MRAVIVDADISYPPTSGKRLRTLNLMLRLAQRHEVTYLCRRAARSQPIAEAVAYFGDHGIEAVVVDDPITPKRGAWFYARLAANLISPLPYSVQSHQSRPMRRAAAELAARRDVDVWQVEWSGYLAALADVPTARTVLIAHNVDTLIWQRYEETASSRFERWFLRSQWRKFERFERAAFNAATRVVAVSEPDAELIRTQFGVPHVAVVDNGIDRRFFESVQGKREPRRVLYLGALDWRPNLDALELLLDTIFPRVLAEEPDARLWIVGRHPPPALARRIRELRWAELHGDVEDVRPYLAQSGMLAVPLRIGGGSRLKILEALACGLPVVSTAIGAEGLRLTPGKDYVPADGPHELADALVAVMRNPARYQSQAERARQIVCQEYDWDVLADRLESVWQDCCRRRQPDPADAAI